MIEIDSLNASNILESLIIEKSTDLINKISKKFNINLVEIEELLKINSKISIQDGNKKNVEERPPLFPQNKINSVNEFEKYNPGSGIIMKGWASIHWLGTTLMLLIFLANYSSFENFQASIFGGLILLSIFGYTSLMDRQTWAYKFELVRNTLGLLFFMIPSQNEFYQKNISNSIFA